MASHNSYSQMAPFDYKQILRRWLFNLRAKNRHGTHSPFVYQFLDRTFYAERRASDPGMHLLLAAVAHFGPKRIGHFTSPELEQKLMDYWPDLETDTPPYDLGLIASPTPQLLSWIENHRLWHNDSLIFVGDLGRGQPAYEDWTAARLSGRISVSIETYRAGLLFFRKEQAPEHFKIRI